MWDQRAKNYDKLFWTKDKEYLNKIIELGDFKQTDTVLDVGTGTGTVAKVLEPKVKQIIGVDISEDMLQKNHTSTVKWDIRDALFSNGIFDKIIARMVFHHIVEDLNEAVKRCYDMLKQGGTIIVAEGVPPLDDRDVVEWYDNMFAHKEYRLTFIKRGLVRMLKESDFIVRTPTEYIMKQFSVKNWLINSGISQEKQDTIMDIHKNANDKIKQAYNMKTTKDDILIDTKNIILTAIK